MLRVGIITTSYPRYVGDPSGSFVAASAEWLARAGHTIEVIAAGDGAGASAESVTVRRIRSGSLFYRGGAPEALTGARGIAIHAASAAAFTARQALAARRHLAGCDVVVAHWLLPSLASALAVPGRPRIIAIAHSGDVDLAIRLRACRPIALAALARGVDLVFVSAALRDRFSAALPARLAARIARGSRICPMGFSPIETAAEPARRGRVVFLGRLVDIKGVDVLIDACARTASARELVVAGDGPRRDELKRRARDRAVPARFVGTVTGQRKHDLLASADVIVVPSRELSGRTEGMPVVALEALATHSRVVVSDSGGLAELPRDLVTHVRPDDVVALARAIDTATARAPDATLLERRRAYVSSKSWDTIGHKLFAPTLTRC